MHRWWAGTCQMTLDVSLHGPWLVRDGEGGSPARPLLDGEGRPVLPASSLKGVLRSCAERILRTMEPDQPNPDPGRAPLADIPFPHARDQLPGLTRRDEIADSELDAWRKVHQQGALPAAGVYLALSAASQLFGATLHAGLLTLEDARFARIVPGSRGYRPHVAIDRFTGGAASGKLYGEDLPQADERLTTTLAITNFALWHLALLGLVFREIERGYSGVGGGTRKGLGRAAIAVREMTVSYPETVYDGNGGIVSAQARLGRLGVAVADLPPAVLAEEKLRLLPTLPARGETNWQEAGTTIVQVSQDDAPLLFAAAVREAWIPWLNAMRPEVAADAAPV